MITKCKAKCFCTLFFHPKIIKYYLIFLFSSEKNYTYVLKENMKKISLPLQPIIPPFYNIVDKISEAKKQNSQTDTSNLEKKNRPSCISIIWSYEK